MNTPELVMINIFQPQLLQTFLFLALPSAASRIAESTPRPQCCQNLRATRYSQTPTSAAPNHRSSPGTPDYLSFRSSSALPLAGRPKPSGLPIGWQTLIHILWDEQVIVGPSRHKRKCLRLGGTREEQKFTHVTSPLTIIRS